MECGRWKGNEKGVEEGMDIWKGENGEVGVLSGEVVKSGGEELVEFMGVL